MIGIDLGTTNSAIAVWQDGKPELIANALGERLTPSVVSVLEDGAIVVGQAAKDRLLTHPTMTIAAFKRWMGSGRSTLLGKRSFRPEELSALVLRQLVDDAARALGRPITEAVISVPAYFSDAQRRATRIAGELAGLKVERLVNEPTAAAIAYGLHDALNEHRILIIDLGGGTLDVSLLEFFDGVMQVHATAGDNFLGGEDFDSVIVDAFLTQHGIKADTLSDIEAAALRIQAVRAKHQLSSAHSVQLSLSTKSMLRNRTLESSLTREQFEALVEPLLTRTRHVIERALRDARSTPSAIDSVVLGGGATRMPMLRNMVGRLFGRLPLSHLSPDEVVAMGAAAQAGLQARDGALQDVVLTDVSPYTLGIEVAVQRGARDHESGHFLPIIERNSTVPVSRVERVVPVQPNQRVLTCEIYQGESRLVKNNIKLGSVEVPLPKDGGDNGVEVRFTYDVNGILEVLIKVLADGSMRRLVINHGGKTLSDTEIEASLTKLANIKVHPREDAPNRALIARAERVYEECLGDDRNRVAEALRAFEIVLDQQQPHAVEAARAALEQALAQFDLGVF